MHAPNAYESRLDKLTVQTAY